MRHINKYYHVFKISISNRLVYVVNYLFQNLFFAFIIFVMLMLWENIYGNKGQVIEGFTLKHIIWYLIVAEIITLSKSNVFREVSEEVKKGNIAYLINKPYNNVFYCLSNSLGEIGIKLFTNILIGIGIGFLYVGPLTDFNLIYIPLIFLSVILGILINFFIYISLALSSFWLEENVALMWVYSKLVFTLGGMLIPLEMFPDWLEKIARNLPFAFVAYGPAKLAVKFDFSHFTHTILFQMGYLVVFIMISQLIFRKGVRALNVNGG